MKFKATYLDYFQREITNICEAGSREDLEANLNQCHGWGNIEIKEIIELKPINIKWSEEDFLKAGVTDNGDRITIALKASNLMWYTSINGEKIGEYYTKEIATDQVHLNLSEEVK
jgi:hypothetical protein